MNLILLYADDFIDADRVRLTGRRRAYVCDVHHGRPETVLRVGRLDGRVGSGTVRTLDGEALEMDVVLDRDPPPPLPLTLVLALPRPKVLRRMLQFVAAAGIKRLVLCNSWCVEKSYWSSPALGEEAVQEQLVLGLEQGADTVLPRVETQRLFKPFVEDVVPGLIAGTRALVAHPGSAEPCPHDVNEPVTLAVGPEGGFTQYEIDLLCAHGFSAVSLGPRPLRVEHAVPALVGRLSNPARWDRGRPARSGVDSV